MTWAIHNLSAPAVEIDERGTYTLNNRDRITLGTPIFEAETFEEVEKERRKRLNR